MLGTFGGLLLPLGLTEAIIYWNLPDNWKEWAVVLGLVGVHAAFAAFIFPTLALWIVVGALILIAAALLITLAGLLRWAVREVRFRRIG